MTEPATVGGETAQQPHHPKALTAGQLGAIPTAAARYAAIVQQRDAEMLYARQREARWTLLAAKTLLAELNSGLSQVAIRAALAEQGIDISDSRISALIAMARSATQGGR